MKKLYSYYMCNNVYIRVDMMTHNYQFLNAEEMWQDDNSIQRIVQNLKCIEIVDSETINKLNGFPNTIDDKSCQISQEDFDKMNDIDKLRHIAQASKKTNHIFENAKLK